MASAVLGTFDLADRFDISGPALNLDSRATLTLSLLLHELATNAVKHGALSVETGKVAITWQIEDNEVVLRWKERGGPAAGPPCRTGFGSRLIKMGLIGKGGSDLSYGPLGFGGVFKASLCEIRHT